ncbi:MAG: ribonuclease III [Thermodesulfobacteriota bacterium]
MTTDGLEERIRYRFRSGELLDEALRHGSAPGRETGKRSYERLEFLGDAVLSLCIAHDVYRLLPQAGEGILTKARAAIINNRNLVQVGERIRVSEHLIIDPSVRRKGSGGVTRKMVADAVEAIIGAIFIDGGYDAAFAFVQEQFRLPDFMNALVEGFDAKSRLQEWCQKVGIELPVYRLLSAEGPAHEKVFRAEVRVLGRSPCQGEGKSKKEAETVAASEMLTRLTASGEDTI